MRSEQRDLAVALSLANLVQLRVWASLLCPPANIRTQHLAGIANTLVLAAVLWCLARIVRWIDRPAVTGASRCILALAVLNAVPSAVRAAWPTIETTPWFFPGRAALFALFVIGVAAAARAGKGPLLSAVTCRLLLAILPAVIVTAGQSALQIVRLSRVAAITAPAASMSAAAAEESGPERAHPRVVVLLLDELDYGLAFSCRPRPVELPALDRFRRESMWASQAYPPHKDTAMSVPSCLLGKLVATSVSDPHGTLHVKLAGQGQWHLLDDFPTLFTALRERGLRWAVVPVTPGYNRLFGRDSGCVDIYRHTPVQARLTREMLAQFLVVAGDSPCLSSANLAQTRERLLVRDAIGYYLCFMAAAERAAADPTTHFTFLHAPAPHRPFIFDRVRGELTAAPGRTYLDNLVLADHTFARVRSVLESHGEWDSTTVIVMSDHWWRDRPANMGTRDHRVLFAMKLAGQHSATEYRSPFNTVLFHDFILSLLQGELRQPADVAHWLDHHRTFGESPLTVNIGLASR